MAASKARAISTTKMNAKTDLLLTYFDHKLTVTHSYVLFRVCLTKKEVKIGENALLTTFSLVR